MVKQVEKCDSGMVFVFKKKIVEREKNDRPISMKSKRPLFVPHWRNDWCVRLPCDMLAGLWKKIEVCALRNGNRTEEKWNFLRWLVVIDWVYICPFSVRSLHLVLLAPPLLLLVFVSAPFSLDFCRKNKGLRISKSDQSVSAMSSVFYATSMNRFHKVPWSVPWMNRCWISHSSVLNVEWGQLWWQK